MFIHGTHEHRFTQAPSITVSPLCLLNMINFSLQREPLLSVGEASGFVLGILCVRSEIAVIFLELLHMAMLCRLAGTMIVRLPDMSDSGKSPA